MKPFALIALIFFAAPLSAAEYIHVDTTTKAPIVRVGTSPFERHDTDPNLSAGFGADRPSMFLLVIRHDRPVLNDVIQQAARKMTGKWQGAYASPDWVVNWEVIAQNLGFSKLLKARLLEGARDAALDVGYIEGAYNLPFSDTLLNFLQSRHYWMDMAISDGALSAGAQTTFEDRSRQEVSLTLTQLKSLYINYGLQMSTITENFVNRRNAIESAGAVSAVDAITWSF